MNEKDRINLDNMIESKYTSHVEREKLDGKKVYCELVFGLNHFLNSARCGLVGWKTRKIQTVEMSKTMEVILRAQF